LNAFVFITTERGKQWEVIDKVLKIEGVKNAHVVSGQNDIIAYTEFANMSRMTEIIDRFQLIEGVVRTNTAIAMTPGHSASARIRFS
jgi:DNA-binding Lrp family transcriptional regulator